MKFFSEVMDLIVQKIQHLGEFLLPFVKYPASTVFTCSALLYADIWYYF